MESNIIKCYEIFLVFRQEFMKIPHRSRPLFKDFIDTKDLGVSVVDFALDLYEITDNKKWFLNKIKYGI